MNQSFVSTYIERREEGKTTKSLHRRDITPWCGKRAKLEKERRTLQLSTSCVIPYIIHVFIIWWASFERRSTREFWICTWSHDGKHTANEQKKTVIWRKRLCTQNYSLKMMNTGIQAIWLITESCAWDLFDIIFLLTFFPPCFCVCCSCIFITQHTYVA